MQSLKSVILWSVLFLSLGFGLQVRAAQTDQTANVGITIGRPFYDYVNLQTYTDISLKNTSIRFLFAPVWLAVDSVTSPEVTIDTPDGYTASGKPYFNLTNQLGDRLFQSGESIGPLRLKFNNPKQLRFNFTLKVLAETEPPIVNNSPSVHYEGPLQINEGQVLAAKILATDPDPDDILTLKTAGLPPGAQFDPVTGNLSWTPSHDQAGSYPVTFTATDSGNLSDQVSVTLVVNDVNRPPALNYDGMIEVDEGQTLTGRLIATDPEGGAVTLAAESLPAGMQFDAGNGRLIWTPGLDQSGNYTPIFTATDNGGLSKNLALDLKVRDFNRPPLIQTQALPPAFIDRPYEFSIEAVDPDGDALHYQLSQSPAGMAIEPNLGRLSWLPQVGDVGSVPVSIQADDGRGGVATRQWLIVVADTVPPSVSLNAPNQAIPGALFTLSADATDNVAVGKVVIAVSGQTPVEFSAPPYEFPIQLPQVLAIGSKVGITATATDTAGNIGQVQAEVQIVAAPDISPPSATLNVPKQITPGQTVTLSAAVADNVGVATVTFYADGQPIGTVIGLNPVIDYEVPADTPLDKPPVFTAKIEDFSGQTATITTDVVPTVSQGPDQAPPQASLEAPAAVEPGASLTVKAKTQDSESGVATVEVYVNHVKVETYFQPLDGDIQVTIPPGLAPGSNVVVELVVTDHAGNQSKQEEIITVKAPGMAVLAGEVYDDQTGLPMPGATVTFHGENGTELTTQSDPRGRYGLSVTAKPGRITIEKAGYTRVERLGLNPPENGAAEVFDTRLTLLQPKSTAVPAVMGATLKAALSPVRAGLMPALQLKGVQGMPPNGELKLDIPPGVLAADTPLSFTPVGPQALQGLLPGGWSPIAAVDIQPHGVSLQVPTHLKASDLLGLGAGHGVILAGWDDTVRIWKAIGPANFADGVFDAELTASGQYAFLVPDAVPQPPPSAQPGKPLAGVAAQALVETIPVTISPDPRILFYQPGVRSEVGVTGDSAAKRPSGTQAVTRLSEDYEFWAGNRLAPGNSRQDLVLYTMAGAKLTAAFPATPTQEFEALSLKKGVITVDLLTRATAAGSLTAIGTTGGTVAAPTGETYVIPQGALTGLSPVELRRLSPDELVLPMPGHLHTLGGVETNLAGKTLAAAAEFQLPRPADVNPGDTVLLIKLVDMQQKTRRILVGLGRIEGQQLISDTHVPGRNDLSFEGPMTEGRYLFVKSDHPVGFAAGRILDPSGQGLDGALVENEALALAALSRNGGRYLSATPVGPFTLSALDPATGNVGTTTGAMPEAGKVIDLDIPLGAQPPQVVMTNPAEGAENIGLTTGILAQFSEALDPVTVNANTIILKGPDGNVEGTFSLGSGDTTVTFRPKQPLVPNTAYALILKTGIKDRAGQSLATENTLHFTSLDTVPPPPPPAGNIKGTIPGTDGKTTVTATQGTAGPHDTVTVLNRTQNLSVPALVQPDGTFSAPVPAKLMDDVVIVIKDAAGNETVVPVGPFKNEDGSTVIGPLGGQLQTTNGVIVTVPTGAFPNGAIVRLTALTEAEIGIPAGPDYPFVAGFQIETSVPAQTYFKVSTPAPQGMPNGANGIIAQVTEAYGVPALSIVDTAKIIENYLTTASPPCPGVAPGMLYPTRFNRYAAYLNNNQLMAMQQSLISSIALGLHRTTIEALISTGLLGEWAPLYPFIVDLANRASSGSGGAVSDLVKQVCMPVPPNTPMKVAIRDADTRQNLQVIDVDPIASGQHADVSLRSSSDTMPPMVIAVYPIGGMLDVSNRRIDIRFSEPVDPASMDTVYLTAEQNADEHYLGKWQLQEGNTLLVFESNGQLPMGETFRLHLKDVYDYAGQHYAGQPVLFYTFQPWLLFPTATDRLDKTRLANGLGVGFSEIPQDLWFIDVDFATQGPDRSYDGKWHTKLAALQGGTNFGYRLFSLDLSDPNVPRTTGGRQIDSRFTQRRVRLIEDATFDIRTPLASTINDFWWIKHTMYQRQDDPSQRICVNLALPADHQKWSLWQESHCQDVGSNCGIAAVGCGDLAITTVDSPAYSYLWAYDVTDEFDIQWASSRLLSDNGVPDHARRYEAPAGSGKALGLAVLPGMTLTHRDDFEHANTIGAYVANMHIGLELADLGLNIPIIGDMERASNSIYKQAIAETLQLNSQLYYTDAAVIPPRQRAGSTGIGARILAIASQPVNTLEIFRPDLVGEPTGITQLPNPPNHVAAATVKPAQQANEQVDLEDLAIVTDQQGGIQVLNIPEDGSKPALIGSISTPASETKHIEVDSEAQVAYVVGSKLDPSTGGDGLLVADINPAQPFTNSVDQDTGASVNRVIGKQPLMLPNCAGPVSINGFRLDREKGLIYAGIKADGENPLAIIKVRQCSDLGVDFKAEPQADPPLEDAQRLALQSLFGNAIKDSGVASGTIAVVAYGERRCLWKPSGCPVGMNSQNRHYRFAILISQSSWERRGSLLEKLHEQVRDAEGEPKPIDVSGLQVKFDDIEFLPLKLEEFENGALSPQFPAGDYGLGRQSLLLELLLDGAFVSGPDLATTQPLPSVLLTLLAKPVGEGNQAKPSSVWQVEGYELAKLQELRFLDTGALIRIHGASELETSLNRSFREELREVARLAMRAVYARLITNQGSNSRLTQDAAKIGETGRGKCMDVSTIDSDLWVRDEVCLSFEHWLATLAAETVKSNLVVFTPNEIVDKVYAFRKVADGLAMPSREEEANAFVAMVYRFITELNSGPVRQTYDVEILSDPEWVARTANLNTAQQRIEELKTDGRKMIKPRFFNDGSLMLGDIVARMYQADLTSGLTYDLTKETSLKAGNEFYFPRQTFVLKNIHQMEPENHGWASFLLDLPNRTVPEGKRKNNWAKLFYYVLDLANPVVSELPQAPRLPVANSDEEQTEMLQADAFCELPQVLRVRQTVNGSESIFMNSTECVDVDVLIDNTSERPLRDVRLSAAVAGTDAIGVYPLLVPHEKKQLRFPYCATQIGAVRSLVFAAYRDDYQQNRSAASNELSINIKATSIGVDAKAEGKDSLLTGKKIPINFTVTHSSDNCLIPTYTWDFGDSSISSEQNPKHAYQMGGSYKPRVEVNCGTFRETDVVEIDIADVEVLINDSVEQVDDVVRLKEEPPVNKVFTTKSRIWLKAPLKNDIKVTLSDVTHRLGLLDTYTQSPPDGDDSLQLMLPKNGNKIEFWITGKVKSQKPDDALLDVKCDDCYGGPIVGHENATVYWFTDAKIELVPDGTYRLKPYNPSITYKIKKLIGSQVVEDSVTFGWNINTDIGAGLIMKAKATVKPDLLNCSAISNIRIAIAQNVKDFTLTSSYEIDHIDRIQGAPVTQRQVPARITFIKDFEIKNIWHNDSDEGSNPLYNAESPNESQVPWINDAMELKLPSPCQGSTFKDGGNQMQSGTWLPDTPNADIPLFYKPFDDAKVYYKLVSIDYKEHFVTWTVTYDLDTHEMVPLRQNEWGIDLTWQNGSYVGDQVKAGLDHEVTHLPMTGPPYANDSDIFHINEFDFQPIP